MTDYSGYGVNEMNTVVIEKNRERLERETWTKAGPVVTRMPDDEVLALEERTMATVGDPSPMGLWAFATGTWIVARWSAGLSALPLPLRQRRRRQRAHRR